MGEKYIGEGQDFHFDVNETKKQEIMKQIAELEQKLVALSTYEAPYEDDIKADDRLKKEYQLQIEALREKLA